MNCGERLPLPVRTGHRAASIVATTILCAVIGCRPYASGFGFFSSSRHRPTQPPTRGTQCPPPARKRNLREQLRLTNSTALFIVCGNHSLFLVATAQPSPESILFETRRVRRTSWPTFSGTERYQPKLKPGRHYRKRDTRQYPRLEDPILTVIILEGLTSLLHSKVFSSQLYPSLSSFHWRRCLQPHKRPLCNLFSMARHPGSHLGFLRCPVISSRH